MKKVLILCLLAAAVAPAQTKQRFAVLPSVGDMEPQGLILLTDKVREIATQVLPIEGFNILKQDVITKMIGEEELYKACKEGVCIGDLAKKTNANYGARCDVIRFNERLVLKFELYSVNEEAIFETFTDYNVKDFDGMLALLEARLPGTFRKMNDAAKAEAIAAAAKAAEAAAKAEAAAAAKAAADSQPKPEADHDPKPKPEFRISAGGGGFYANDIGGGIKFPDGRQVAMPRAGGGAYLFVDAVYAEAFVGYSAGGGKWESADAPAQPRLPAMQRAGLNFGAFAKYPFDVGAPAVKIFPLIGIDYEAPASGKLVYANGTEYAFDGRDGRDAASSLAAVWVKFGGGLDVGLGENAYLRAELLYGFRTASAFEKDCAATMYEGGGDVRTGQGNGVNLKIGVGMRL